MLRVSVGAQSVGAQSVGAQSVGARRSEDPFRAKLFLHSEEAREQLSPVQHQPGRHKAELAVSH